MRQVSILERFPATARASLMVNVVGKCSSVRPRIRSGGWLVVATCLVLVFLAARASADESRRRYELAGHGAFELSVLTAWKDDVRRPPGGLPPTVTLRPAGGE